MNRAESERLSALLDSQGYTGAPGANQADLVIINSCVVRASAEDRVVNKLMLLKHIKQSQPHKQIALTGCFVPDDIKALKKRFPFVNYFFKAGERPDLPDLEAPGEPCLPREAGLRSLVPIIQGCNNFCSYCIVPYRRGREKSRQPGEVHEEVAELVARGAREVILLGQNVDSYGQDLESKADLAGLLESLNTIRGLQRIRFLTNHPKDMSLRLIETMASLDKVCEQVNLPVQSGDNSILRAMKRGYTVELFKSLVGRLRNTVPGVAITTDIIVGFPGEEEKQFQNTLALLAELRFDSVHIARYSPREQTLASSRYKDIITEIEKKRRAGLVEENQTEISREINKGLIGKTVEVLVEGRKKGKWYGRSRSDKPVFFKHEDNWFGKLVPVKIEQASPWSLTGCVNINSQQFKEDN